ncbi:MAG: hypothetical protein R3F12_08645 [Lysobacteraceae bacterium]
MATIILSRTIPALFLATALLSTVSEHTHASTAQSCKSIELVVDPLLKVPDDVMTAVCSYYTAENASDWRSTYEMRPKAFRQLVPFDFYAKSMTKEKMGHGVFRLIVTRFAPESEGGIEVGFDFLERRSNDRAGYLKTTDETTIWRKEDDAWRCVACGQRGRFISNHQMTYP